MVQQGTLVRKTYEMVSRDRACSSLGAQYWPSPNEIRLGLRPPWLERIGRHTVSVIGASILESVLVYRTGDRHVTRMPSGSTIMCSTLDTVRDGVIGGFHISVVLHIQSALSTGWPISTQLTMGIDSFQEAMHAALVGDFGGAVL